MDQSEPQEILTAHQQWLATLCQQRQHERQQNETAEKDFDRVELG